MLLRQICIIALLINIVGCSHIYGEDGIIKNRENEYMKAENMPNMQVPPGYTSDTITPNYPVPDKEYPLSAARVKLTPPGLNPATK